MNVWTNAPRHLRSHLHCTLQPHTLQGAEEHTLYLLSPTQTGCKAWRFAVLYHNEMVLIGKPVKSRDVGRREGVARYGYKAQEVRGNAMPKAPKQPKAAKPSYKERVAAALGAA